MAGLTGDKPGHIALYWVAACEEPEHVVLTQQVLQSSRDLLTARDLSFIVI